MILIFNLLYGEHLLIALIKYTANKPLTHEVFNILAKLTTFIKIKNKIQLLKNTKAIWQKLHSLHITNITIFKRIYKL